MENLWKTGGKPMENLRKTWKFSVLNGTLTRDHHDNHDPIKPDSSGHVWSQEPMCTRTMIYCYCCCLVCVYWFNIYPMLVQILVPHVAESAIPSRMPWWSPSHDCNHDVVHHSWTHQLISKIYYFPQWLGCLVEQPMGTTNQPVLKSIFDFTYLHIGR